MTHLVSRIMIISDATWSVTYDHHSDNHNSFIIWATESRTCMSLFLFFNYKFSAAAMEDDDADFSTSSVCLHVYDLSQVPML
jgi:hypothetical protein